MIISNRVLAPLMPHSAEVIREILPAVRRIAVLANASDPFHEPFVEQIKIGANELKIERLTR